MYQITQEFQLTSRNKGQRSTHNLSFNILHVKETRDRCILIKSSHVLYLRELTYIVRRNPVMEIGKQKLK